MNRDTACISIFNRLSQLTTKYAIPNFVVLSSGAGLCGVFLTLHKAYTLLQASVKKLKKEKKKTKLAQNNKNTAIIKCNCPCQQLQTAQSLNEVHIQEEISQTRV